MNAKTATAQTLRQCLCGTFEIVIREWVEESGQPEIETEATGCTEKTRRDFAPGHDASLKSLLIRAGIAGREVRRDVNGVTHISSAEIAAQGFGFVYMVTDGIARGIAKAAAKAAVKADKAARPARTRKAKSAAPVEAAQPETVKVRVGRWEYAATIVDGDAHYQTKQGAAVAVAGTYKLV